VTVYYIKKTKINNATSQNVIAVHANTDKQYYNKTRQHKRKIPKKN
jgi:hypothetical protein